MAPGDVTEEYVSWLNDPETTRYLKTKSASMESQREYVRNRLVLGIYVGPELIGTMGLAPSGDGLTVGVMIAKKFRGKGYAAQALKKIGGKLYANIIPENTASIRAFEKAGFDKAEIGGLCIMKRA